MSGRINKNKEFKFILKKIINRKCQYFTFDQFFLLRGEFDGIKTKPTVYSFVVWLVSELSLSFDQFNIGY